MLTLQISLTLMKQEKIMQYIILLGVNFFNIIIKHRDIYVNVIAAL